MSNTIGLFLPWDSYNCNLAPLVGRGGGEGRTEERKNASLPSMFVKYMAKIRNTLRKTILCFSLQVQKYC